MSTSCPKVPAGNFLVTQDSYAWKRPSTRRTRGLEDGGANLRKKKEIIAPPSRVLESLVDCFQAYESIPGGFSYDQDFSFSLTNGWVGAGGRFFSCTYGPCPQPCRWRENVLVVRTRRVKEKTWVTGDHKIEKEKYKIARHAVFSSHPPPGIPAAVHGLVTRLQPTLWVYPLVVTV